MRTPDDSAVTVITRPIPRAEDKLAGTLADEVIRASTDFDGTERAPMRTAEARITMGVIAVREGDIERAYARASAL